MTHSPATLPELPHGADHFADTARAFDAAAPDYDGPSGNNALVQIMRAALWREVEGRTRPGANLLDLGCGTGLDAAHFCGRGYAVCALDQSTGMVDRTRRRAAELGLEMRVERLGIQQLAELDAGPFDAIYSDLGPFNCVPDLASAGRAAAALLKPDGVLVLSVMGRTCPWEQAYYALRGNWAQVRRRAAAAAVPVNLGSESVWTRYYTPREFLSSFSRELDLISYRALNLFLPPPYLIRWYERARGPMRVLGGLDARLGHLPVLRDMGDHFLITLAHRRGSAARPDA